MKVTIAGFGMMGCVRAVAYEAVQRYFPRVCPEKYELYEASVQPGQEEGANDAGWKATTELVAALSNPEAWVVDICLPNSMHYEAAKIAFENGKHVFCEKPLAGNLLDAYKMAEIAATHPDQLASVNYIYRRSPAAIYARKILQEGRFGKVMEVVCSYPQSWGGPETPYSWRFDDEGGALADLGSHALDMLYFQTGMRPIEVLGLQTTHIKERKILSEKVALSIKETRPERVVEHDDAYWFTVKIDDATDALFTLPGGAIGSLHCTRNAWGTENSHNFVIYCEHGALRWNYDDLNYLEIYDARTPERGWVRMLCDRKECAYFNFADGHMIGYRDLTVFACYENLRKICGLPEIAPIATFADALEVERTIAAIRRSWKERRWVKLSEITRPEE